MAGYETAKQLTDELKRVFGKSVSPNTLYGVERGERAPSAELLVMLMIVLDPPGGMEFIASAVRPELRDDFRSLSR
jgi:transcriptional regulator with XRE-family HTH domain